MIKTDYAPYTLWLEDGRMPSLLDHYAKGAKLYEEIDLKNESPGDWCFVGVSRDDGMPFLAVTMRYSPSGAGFSPGILLVPETNILFIGAGQRVLAYDLHAIRRVVHDSADTGFWGWKLHGDVVVMSAELEIAAWTSEGSKLWSHFADPPWTYQVAGRRVLLKADSFQKEFDLYAGPGY